MGLLRLFSSRFSLQDSGFLNGSTDRHSHVLYGVDDGVKTAEESLAVLTFMESVGVRELWCTPHIMEDVPNTTESLQSRFEELCSIYEGPVRLRLAAEYMMDTLFEERLRSRDLLTMEDDLLLMETSTLAPPYDFKGIFAEVMSSGYRPLFAHPERCRFLEVGDMEELAAMGVKFQMNIASLTGYYGPSAKEKSKELLKKGLYHAYGSDCHRLSTIKQQYSRREFDKSTIQKMQNIA